MAIDKNRNAIIRLNIVVQRANNESVVHDDDDVERHIHTWTQLKHRNT